MLARGRRAGWGCGARTDWLFAKTLIQVLRTFVSTEESGIYDNPAPGYRLEQPPGARQLPDRPRPLPSPSSTPGLQTWYQALLPKLAVLQIFASPGTLYVLIGALSTPLDHLKLLWTDVRASFPFLSALAVTTRPPKNEPAS